MRALVLALPLALPLALGPLATLAQEAVVALGGSITEIVYALGEEDRLVARDSTSSWPEAALDLPDVGYVRALSPEGVLSVGPDLILAEEGAGPAEAVEVLRKANVAFVTVPEVHSHAGILDKVRVVGDALGVPDKAAALIADLDARLTEAEARAAATPEAERKRVLFVLSTADGRIMVSGSDTAADAIIAMAGGVNAARGFTGYKPLTPEAVTAAAPDVVLMMDRGGDHSATTADLFAMPALAVTPAARTQALVKIDGLLLLGFGPRTAEAVTRLHDALHGG